MSFDTLVNFRDLGGLKMKDGRQIRMKKLLRSGEPVNLSDYDKVKLAEKYDLQTIIDFRSQKEITEKPDDAINDARYYHIDLFKAGEQNTLSLEEFKRNATYSTPHDEMIHVYEFLITGDVPQTGFREFFDIVATNDTGAVLWHCFAGKDRTGISAALLLHALGADEATIFEDYLATNESRRAANEVLFAQMAEEGLSAQQIERARTMMIVKADFLQHAINIIHANYTNIDTYLHDVLQISDEMITTLRDKYLV